MKKTLFILLAISAAAGLGWYFGRRSHSHDGGDGQGERKVAFYQSPMHPWIKSDKPGNCTICGMKLTPVFEGEKGFDIDGNVVTLSSNAINVVHVQSEPAARHPIERTLRVAGRIEAQENRYKMLSAYVDGRVEKLFVNYVGAEVQQGEPLALIYSPALLTAEREYLTALNQTNLAGFPKLAGAHERLVEGARHRLKRLGLTDEQIDDMRSGSATNLTTQIVAPIGGTVLARAVVEGQYVKEGDKLFEIADLSQMWFRFDVYEQDLPSIHVGQIVEVASPALGDKTFEGPITFIDPTINEMTRSARVRVDLQNPLFEQNGRKQRLLYNGLFANGTIALRTEPVLAVSRGAVIDPGDQPRVYVDKGGGAYEHRLVTLGARGERYVEIREGLNPGDLVVTAGGLLLDSQAQINQTGSVHRHDATHPEVTAHESPRVIEFSAEQNNAAADFLAAASKVAEALAADDPQKFNDQILPLPELATKLKVAFEPAPHLAGLTTEVAKNAELKPAQNLNLARTRFLPFSMAVAKFTQAFKKHGGSVSAKVFKCPMYPRTGQTAYWVQSQGPLRNPFFGSEMLECGVEVK